VTERVTLITGASAGIGAELARVFASKGYRVALTARRADRLNALAAEIKARGGAVPIIIPCDLRQPDAGSKIAEALTAAGVEVRSLLQGKPVRCRRTQASRSRHKINCRWLAAIRCSFKPLDLTGHIGVLEPS
jgi:short-subunit dehydrogenase